MTDHASKSPQSYWAFLNLVLRSGQRIYRTAAILLAISPPVLAAIYASDAQGWDLFERSGAMTSMIGLLLAARHYLHRGVVEIAARDRSSGSNSDMTEILEDIHATKLGLAVSAFGTLIWGAGKYLQWWTFGYLVIWAAIAARDSWRDFVRLRDRPPGSQIPG